MDALFAPPRNHTDQHRMRHAHQRAAHTLQVTCPSGPEAWGWQGRTLSRRCGDRWLRVASQRLDKPIGHLWDGTTTAEAHLPRTLPRPRILDFLEWTSAGHRYRGELSELVPWPALQTGGPALTREVNLPDPWWSELAAALNTLALVPTTRQAVPQRWIDNTFPRYLGIPPVTITHWVTGHADLHWANLCGPTLAVLDWEGWGRVPAGYDPGLLCAYTLRAPATAARARSAFAHVLDTPPGRIGELVALAQLLQVVSRGHHTDLADAITARAQHITGRPVPRGIT